MNDAGHEGVRVPLSAARRGVVIAFAVIFALAATGVVANFLAQAHTKKVAGGFLYFRPVLCTIASYRPSQGLSGPIEIPPAGGICSSASAVEFISTPPFDDTPTSTVILPYYDNSRRYVLGPADVNGSAVATTSVNRSNPGGYQVTLTFTHAGAAEFDQVASQRYPFYAADPANPPYKSLEAIELHGTVVSAVVIRDQSFNGVTVAGSTAAPLTSQQADARAQNIGLARNQPPLVAGSPSTSPTSQLSTPTAPDVYPMRMARVNITMPDQLYAQAKESGLNISQLAQQAVARELARLAKAADLDAYLAELDAELGPITEREQAEAQAWADRALGPAKGRRSA